jgi:hypothetical protein
MDLYGCHLNSVLFIIITHLRVLQVLGAASRRTVVK